MRWGGIKLICQSAKIITFPTFSIFMNADLDTNTRTFIWGHRGASGHEIENTLESFKLAIEMGADGIESDVNLTKERNLIFYHDQRVNWKGKKIPPSRMLLKDLKSVDLGDHRQIPEVSQIFQYFKSKTTLNGDPIRYSLDLGTIYVGRRLIRLAHKQGVAQSVEITPSDNFPTFWTRIKQFRAHSQDINIVCSAKFDMYRFKFATKRMFFQNWDKFHQYNIKGINLRAKYATRSLIEDARKQNLKIYVWDCHDELTIQKFMKLKVDAIYSNYPDLAVKIREEIQP
ncbi:hypothetical protein ES708_01612 [subsurface metagenome]